MRVSSIRQIAMNNTEKTWYKEEGEWTTSQGGVCGARLMVYSIVTTSSFLPFAFSTILSHRLLTCLRDWERFWQRSKLDKKCRW